MGNVVLGSFVGFFLAVTLLAACGGSSFSAAASQPAAAGEYRWAPPAPRVTIANGIALTGGGTWQSGTIVENAGDDGRHRFGLFEIAGNADGGSSGALTLEVGLLPAPDGVRFATTPQWVGTLVLESGSNARASLYGVVLPPARFKVALRLVGSSATTRLSLFALTPYSEQQL